MIYWLIWTVVFFTVKKITLTYSDLWLWLMYGRKDGDIKLQKQEKRTSTCMSAVSQLSYLLIWMMDKWQNSHWFQWEQKLTQNEQLSCMSNILRTQVLICEERSTQMGKVMACGRIAGWNADPHSKGLICLMPHTDFSKSQGPCRNTS